MAIERKIFGSIGKKILLWFLVISITPAAGITFISYWNSKKLIEEQLAGLLDTTADMVSKEIYSFIKVKKAKLVDFSADGLIRDGVMVIDAGEPGGNEAIIERLNHHLSMNKVPLDHDIIEAFVIDSRGKVVASSNETWLGMDASHKDYFIEGWRHGIYVSDMWWPATEDEPTLTMSRVITNLRTG
ncbi:MAG TPA: hypothetical protein VI387_08255, partial [Candidatus Brocadiales bacterium]|nr:hypothetical protein [Candidatus Brocadiales bacterium]